MARTVRYIALLGLLLTAVSAAAGYLAARRYGPEAYQASAAAAALNWIAGSVALWIFAASEGKMWRLQAALLGMLVRMSLPMAAIAFFTHSTHPFASHGVVMLILIHYLVGLIVETACCVRLVNASAVAGDAVGSATNQGRPRSPSQ